MSNGHLFVDPELRRTRARAEGIDLSASGHEKSGGIIAPQEVILNENTVLIRLFSKGDGPGGFSDWWNTPHELNNVIKYLGVNGAGLTARGTNGAMPAFHYMLALLPWWTSADRFHVIRLRNKLHAFHGEGSDAIGQRRGSSEIVVKAGKLVDTSGKQRGVRQIFIPDFRFYANFNTEVCGMCVETDLCVMAQSYDKGPMSFET